MKHFLQSNKAWRILSLSIAVWGLFFFTYKIFFSDYELNNISATIIEHYKIIIIEIFLLFFNFFCESKKWQNILLSNNNTSTLLKCLNTSLIATAFGNSTFGGIGEHVARANSHINRKTLIAQSFISSIMQTSVICFYGLVALPFTNIFSSLEKTIIILLSIICISALIIYKNRNRIESIIKKHINWNINEISKTHIIKALCWNILRLFTFSFQLYLLVNIDNQFNHVVFIHVLVYYFIITLLPSVHLIDIGIKGSTALFVFACFASENNINTAIILIWIINTLLPSTVGFILSFVQNSQKKSEESI